MLRQDDFDDLLIDKSDDGVATVTLNRPDALNAVTKPMHAELARFTRAAQADHDVRVVLVKGAGRAFCGGGDFSTDEWSNVSPHHLEEGRQIVDNLLEMTKPIVSAVQGYAFGIGATLSLLCDVVVASPSTVFADPHVKMALGAGDGGAVIWPLLMGVNRAKWMLMTGDRITGTDLYDLGLVNFLVDDDEIQSKALECATRLASGPPDAIAACKVPINKYIRSISNLVLPLSMAMEGANTHSAEHAEAQRAFAEKREPDFTKGGTTP
ncbi:MAG: enoyl-CoA hydratase/isomerase family protein [Microthrixaceae bacterium]